MFSSAVTATSFIAQLDLVISQDMSAPAVMAAMISMIVLVFILTGSCFVSNLALHSGLIDIL
jgi:hypothetical protein